MSVTSLAILGIFLLDVNVQWLTGASDIEQLILRWVHFLAGITWIGLLYFFNLVNVPVMKVLDGPTKGKVVPVLLPKALWWFRWSAVVTVLAGFRYFMILAKAGAEQVIKESNGAITSSTSGLMWKWLGLWFLVWVIVWAIMYFFLLPKQGVLNNGKVLTVIFAIVVAGASWWLLGCLADPGADNRTLSTALGGGMGLVMLLNVWGIIWRCQKKIIAWTKANAEQGTPIPPESAKLARQAFLASRTNFYLSIPMLFFMATSAHYPFLSGK